MAKGLVKTEINVIDNKIEIMRIVDVDYISLTDIAFEFASWLSPNYI